MVGGDPCIAVMIAELSAELEYMYENLSGCDWCCGGGDEDAAQIRGEIEALQAMLGE